LKKLDAPEIDDVAITTEISENDLLHQTSYPHLKASLDRVLACYGSYCNVKGNALAITPLGLVGLLKVGLMKNYSHPPKSLSFLADIRKLSPRVCPMCGSLKPFTLDHILPKDDYAEYAVFSKNLVPACDCNLKRGKTLANPASSVRVLHPYFDSCLAERLLSCDISPDSNFPLVKIEIAYVNPGHPLAGSIEFHSRSIVLRSGIVTWLSGQWASAVDCPGAVIQTMPHSVIISVDQMRLVLEDALNRHDQRLGTPNNWESIFVHGLLASPDAMEWLRLKHNSQYL
jgi:hypothetical protein